MEAAYLDLKRLAAYTSLSPSTLRQLMRDPLDPLPSFMIGRSRRFARQAVDAWMTRRIGAQTAQAHWLADLRARHRKSTTTA